MNADLKDMQGGCLCGDIRFTLSEAPMIVHACHCLDCQRISGSAFILNMWIEQTNLQLTNKQPVSFLNKGGSGATHEIFCCGHCGTDLWSRYHSGLAGAIFVRAGLLDDPTGVEPDVHIFIRNKQRWLQISHESRTFEAFYDIKSTWSKESLQRLKTLKQNISEETGPA